MASSSTTKFLKSPIKWPGSKRNLAPVIIAYMPPHAAYAEICCGSASVFWAKPKGLSKAEILNDADGELMNFYYMLHKCGRRLAEHVDIMPYARAWFVTMLKAKPYGLFARAARFWYLNRVAFGAKRSEASFGVQATRKACVLPESILANLDATIERLHGVVLESLDAGRMLALYDRPDTLFYVDPPYYNLNQPYACRFSREDHERLAAGLVKVRGTWLLSYNVCHAIRRLYAGRYVRRLDHRYTIGCNSATASSDKAMELLISNRPLRVRNPGINSAEVPKYQRREK